MKTLYVTNGFPYPLTSGYLRHYFLIRELSSRHEITLVSMVGRDFSSEHVRPLQELGCRVVPVQSGRRGGLVSRTVRRAARLAGLDPAAHRLASTVAQLVAEERFDAALLSGKEIFPVLDRLSGMRVVVDVCDATSCRLWGSLRYRGWWRVPYLLADYVRVRHIERALLRQARHLLFASCRDRDALLDDLTVSATVVPNGVDCAFWRRSSATLGRDTIVFTGALDYGPNSDAAAELVNRLLPLVRRARPNVRLLVVGRNPARSLIADGHRAGARITGPVADVRPYLDEATVFAAPIRFGAGIQNKLLEALAMELPVVASSLAADGLRTDRGARPPLQTADTTSEFADRLVEELAWREADPTPNRPGRCYVQQNFDWQHSGAVLDRLLKSEGNPKY